MTDGEVQVTVATIFGAKSRQAIVTLQWGDRAPFQVTTAKAREIAMMLLEAAESADQDGFIIVFAQRLGLDEGQAAQVLGEFRTWREREGQDL